MSIVRWEPFRELSGLQTEMNRLFNSVFEVGNGTRSQRWIPPMDLVETDDDFILRADLPGMTEKDVTIEFEDGVLTIHGERLAEQEKRREGYYRLERSFGSFSRSLTVPKGINPKDITANFKNGVLEVRVKKPVETKPHKITIDLTGESKVIEGESTKK